MHRHCIRSFLALATAAFMFGFAGPACEAQEMSPLRHSRQCLLVVTPGWDSPHGEMRLFERASTHAAWQERGAPVRVVLGRAGLAWGRGALEPGAGLLKAEGDGRAPAGVFELGSAFGHASSISTRMPWRCLTPKTEAVDDPRSRFYNQIVERDQVEPDWRTSEKMLKMGPLYELGIVVKHNSAPVAPGAGSAIFIHIWRRPGAPTSGCTAMARARLVEILAWLDPAASPLLVQLPAAEFTARRGELFQENR